MDNRLLSEQEMFQTVWDFAQTVSEEELDKLQQIDRFQIISAAQLAKDDKWWVSNLNDEFTVIRLTDELDDVAEGDYVAMPVKRWNELKESVK